MIFTACLAANMFQMASAMVSYFITEVNCWSLYFIIFFVIDSSVKWITNTMTAQCTTLEKHICQQEWVTHEITLFKLCFIVVFNITSEHKTNLNSSYWTVSQGLRMFFTFCYGHYLLFSSPRARKCMHSIVFVQLTA